MKDVTPSGKGTTFLPAAKSSIRMAKEAPTNALEQDPKPNNVYFGIIRALVSEK